MKKIFAIAVAALMAVSANAQDCCKAEGQCCGGFTPNWFVQLQGGIQLPNTPGMSKLVSPAFSFNLGRNVTPLVSVRAGIEGLNSKVYSAYSDDKLSFKYATASFDGMLNLVNLLGGKPCSPVALYAIGGVGCNWSGMETNNSSKFSPNVRLGAMLDWRVAKTLSVNLEYRADNTNDQFNGRLSAGSHDWYSSVLLGLSLQLPNNSAKLKAAEDKINQLQQQYDAARAAAEAAQAEAAAAKAAAAKAIADAKAVKPVTNAVAKVEKETSLPYVFFQCAKSNVQKAQQGNVASIAKWMNENPQAQIVITGYASPDGSAQLNQKLSEKRANAVADMLVKKYGIAADRISTKAGGETSEIFSQNNLNRVAVSVAK